MENNLPDINLRTISKVTGLLCRAGTRIRQQENEKEIIKKERIIRIKKKIEMLESKYEFLKKKHQKNIKLSEIKIYFDIIKNRLEKISV